MPKYLESIEGVGLKQQEVTITPKKYLERKRRREKRLRRILWWFKTIMLVSLTITTLVLLALSPLFNITAIEVHGNRHYTSEEIVQATGIAIGSNGFKNIGSNWKNIFALRFGESEEYLLHSKPYIEHVTVRFILPGTVRVTLTERKPLAVVNYMGNEVIVDKNGYALDYFVDDAEVESIKLPAILGVGIKSLRLGQVLEFETQNGSEGFYAAVRLLLSIKESDESTETYKLYKYVDSVDAGDPKNIILGFDGRFRVKFGDLKELDHNLNFFRYIYYSNLKYSNDRGTLDMTALKPVLIEETAVD